MGNITGTVTIGSAVRDLSDVEQGWLAQQITRERREHGSVCVEVRLNGDVDLRLAAGACPRGGGAPAAAFPPTERRIIDEWFRLDLNDTDVAIGKLGQFFRFLERL